MFRTRVNQKYEDTVQCLFFSVENYSNTEWQQLCDSINDTILFLSQDYIWHRDELKVVLPIIFEDSKDLPNHLVSIVCFGDNIEDEWYIVYILLEISKKYPDLIIQIEDNDGDFLLIEAADYLPPWANPDSTENRVFIYKHSLHILPPSIASTHGKIKLNEALSLVTQKSDETKASPEIQQAILKRISKFPHQINENFHKAIILLPLEIAAVLKFKPSLISYLVSAFCSLDPLDLKFKKSKKVENYSFDDCCNVEVKFTKFLYAQLKHTRIPNGCGFITKEKDSKTVLGLKLMYGYKTIMSKSSVDIFSTQEFNTFVNSLHKNGYFKDNLNGSIEYTRLLENAKKYFSNMDSPVSAHVYNIVNNIKSTDKFASMVEYLKNKSSKGLLEEDDDSWLNIHPDELNTFLNNHYGKKHQRKYHDPITPHIINSELTNFLKQTSDYEGIEVNEENLIEDSIDFDTEQFSKCIEKMLTIISNADVCNEESEFSDNYSDDDVSLAEDLIDIDQDKELASKLEVINEESSEKNSDEISLQNFIQSMKEEGLSGPASTVFKTIGLKKIDLIDSDDD